MNQYRPSGFSYLPLVVKNLLIINGLFFLATYVLANTMQINLTEKLGLYYFGSEKFRPYQIITHLFMHGSMAHIFSNMFALWMFGTAIENIWGPKKFLSYYMVTGLGAALLHTFINYLEISGLQQAVMAYLSDPTLPNFEQFVFTKVPAEYKSIFNQVLDAWAQSGNEAYREQSMALSKELLTRYMDIPTVGASGAVFGVLLAFGMMFPNSMIYVFFAIPIRAKYFVAIYAFIELYLGAANNPGDNVAHFAHLGGMLFGYFLIRYWNRNRFKHY